MLASCSRATLSRTAGVLGDVGEHLRHVMNKLVSATHSTDSTTVTLTAPSHPSPRHGGAGNFKNGIATGEVLPTCRIDDVYIQRDADERVDVKRAPCLELVHLRVRSAWEHRRQASPCRIPELTRLVVPRHTAGIVIRVQIYRYTSQTSIGDRIMDDTAPAPLQWTPNFRHPMSRPERWGGQCEKEETELGRINVEKSARNEFLIVLLRQGRARPTFACQT